MNWKVKAFMQRSMARLPEGLARAVYFGVQRSAGQLRSVDVAFLLRKAAFFLDAVRRAGGDVRDRTVLDLGTGWTLAVPLGLWLGGAGRVVTVDKYRHFRSGLAVRVHAWMQAHEDEVAALLGEAARTEVFRRRWQRLREARAAGPWMPEEIVYEAPCDAARLALPDGSVDYYCSTNVLEHVPAAEIRRLHAEARRVLAPGGLLLHRIDLGDHYARTDRSITTVNFLAYSEAAWQRRAGNPFAYHNRLRADDYYRLFAEMGAEIVWTREVLDERARAALEDGFPLDARFAGEAPERLAVRLVEVVARFG